MKKLVFLLCFVLISCGNQNTVEEYIEPPVSEVTYADELWWTGKLDNDVFQIQVHVNENTAFGKYKIGDREVLFRGTNDNGVVNALSEDFEEMIIVHDESSAYGIFLESELKFYAGEKSVQSSLSKSSERLAGNYLSYTSDYFVGRSVEVTPLFDHMLLIKHRMYAPAENEESIYVALKDDDVFRTITGDKELKLLEYDISFDGEVYSESFQYDKPTLLSLGIAEDITENVLLENILGDYLDVVIDNSFKLTLEPITGNGFRIIKSFGYYYISLSKEITFESQDIYIYNENMDKEFSGKEIFRPILTGGFETLTSGTLEELIPDDYYIKDKITGLLNGDNREDIVLVLDNDQHTRVLMILIANGEGYDVDLLSHIAVLSSSEDEIDPYESIKIEDGTLTLKLYGGKDKRWSECHTFSTRDDYRLLSSEITLVGESTRLYDFINHEVIVSKNSTQLIYKKRIKESLFLYTFDGEKLFDQDYR